MTDPQHGQTPASAPVPATPPAPAAAPMPAAPTPPPAGPPMPPAGRRPSLSRRQKRGARTAGALGFLLFTIGFSATAMVATVLLIVAVFGGLMYLIEDTGGPVEVMIDWMAWAMAEFGWLAAVIGIGGIVVWILGYVLSVAILKGTGNTRAHGITWASLGIAIVAFWVLSSILSSVANIAFAVPMDFSAALDVAFYGGIGMFALNIVVTVLIGMFTWWWMAHALRPRVPQQHVADAGPAPVA